MGGAVKCGLIFEDMQVWGLRDCDNWFNNNHHTFLKSQKFHLL